MTSDLTSDFVLFPILAVVGAVPLFFLVASAMRMSLQQARETTLEFLNNWAKITPLATRRIISSILGYSTGFALLVALAYGLNGIADNTMPFFSRLVGHFGNRIVIWSVEHEKDWKDFRGKFAEKWESEKVKENPDAKETANEMWEEFKTKELDKWQVRFTRTLFFFSLLLVIAGLIDALSRRYRKRGVALLIVGLVSTTLCLNYWVYRKAHYIDRIRFENRQLNRQLNRLDLLEDEPDSLKPI